MKRKNVITIVNIILVAVFLFSAFNVVKINLDYNKANNIYGKMQDTYVAFNKKVPTPEQTKEPELPITVDFDSLLNRNNDVVGWLYCPDTVVNYPVVKGENNDQYLRRDIDGKYLISGTLFADYRNDSLNQSANYIIYGHNMKNGTMFSMITKYKQQAHYDQYPTMYYLTPDANYKLELFAGLVVKRDDKVYFPNQSKDAFFQLANEYRTKSTFKSDVELNYNDTIITLSTCSYEFDNARYIVFAKLTRI